MTDESTAADEAFDAAEAAGATTRDEHVMRLLSPWHQSPHSLVPAMSVAEYQNRVMFRLSVIAWIVALTFASSVAGGVWFAVKWHDVYADAATSEDADGDVSGMTYDECMADSDTTASDCLDLPGS